MDDQSFQPGFRFSTLDLIVLVLGLIIGGGFGAVMFWPGMAILFVMGHFFLFCNVVRMERRSELIWAALFVGLSAATILAGVPSWPVTFAVSLLMTLILLVREARKPSYHGVLWQRLNPSLPDWWSRAQHDGYTK